MIYRSLSLTLALLLLSACSSHIPSSLLPPKNWVGGDAIQPQLLASGTFKLPLDLISAGSGQLVSAGSGQLVSAGSAHYRVQALAELPVSGASVTLLDPRGPAGVALASAMTDTSGHYTLLGSPRTGIYEMAATLGGKHYLSLTALSATQAPQADIDVATTLVSQHLLEEPGGLRVLAVAEFTKAAASLAQVLDATDLPPNWTPVLADATLATALHHSTAAQNALGALDSQQAHLQARMGTLGLATQALASQLGVAPSELTQRLAVALSQNPQSSDAQIVSAVRAAAISSPLPPGTPPSAGPQATVSSSPVPTGQPIQALFPSPTATAVPAPTPTAPIPTASTPTPAPLSSPTPTPLATPASVASSQAIPTPSPIQTTAATPTPQPTITPTFSGSPRPASPTPVPSASANSPGDERNDNNGHGSRGNQFPHQDNRPASRGVNR